MSNKTITGEPVVPMLPEFRLLRFDFSSKRPLMRATEEIGESGVQTRNLNRILQVAFRLCSPGEYLFEKAARGLDCLIHLASAGRLVCES